MLTTRLLFLMLIACTSDWTTAATYDSARTALEGGARVRSLFIRPDTMRLEVGDTALVRCEPYNGPNGTGALLATPCTWASLKPAKVTVNGSGQTARIIARDTGFVGVTATAKQRRDTATVAVLTVIAGSPEGAELYAPEVTVQPHTILLSGDTARATLQGHVREPLTGPVASASWTWTVRNTAVVQSISSTKSAVTLVPVADGNTYVVGAASGDSDSAAVTVTGITIPPPPPPPTGTTYFLATYEGGTLCPDPWNWCFNGGSGSPAVNSMTQAKNGTRSAKHIMPAGSEGSSFLLDNTPHSSMGCVSGHFCTGYYSFYAYIESGFAVANQFQMLLGWMTAVSGAPSPISHIELSTMNSVLQLRYVLKNCAVGLYTCPTIAGYSQAGGAGYYLQTASSPNGITAFPRNQWVHIAVYYKMAETNGQVTIWQDGILIYDLTAPTMNTFGGHSIAPLTNAAGDLMLQHGIYGGVDPIQRVMYVDDFRVSNFRPVP